MNPATPRSRHSISRRRMLQTAGLAAPAALSVPSLAWAGRPGQQEASEGTTDPPPLRRLPRMVHDHFVSLVREAEAAGHARPASLATRADAERYVRDTRQRIRECFGPFPERTPLNARVTGTVERDAYRIEKVIFESRPGFPVTANLYVPRGRRFPLPGVVGTCGHSVEGKAAEAYQSFAQGLARQGYVTLIFDPIGQGERLQYVDEQLRPRRGTGTSEHLYAGNQQFVVGEFLGTWRAWDAMRALDYLLGRPEVDRRHVGVTGNSGGGTMTTWLCGLEDRFTMAAPGCFVTTFRRNMENELPADTEQCPPRALALGLDHADFIAAFAPRPVILLGKERDFFDIRGLEEAYARLKRLYRLLGAESQIELFVGPTEHGFTRENREAMYRWFNRVTGVSDATAEPGLTIEKEETLWCTPRGQVGGLRPRTVFDFTRERAEDLRKQRRAPESGTLKSLVREALRLPVAERPPEYRIWRPSLSRRYPKPHAATYAVETERGIFAVVYRLGDEPQLSRPPRGASRALLYVSHRSADAELRGERFVAGLMEAEPATPVYACDVRGVGESLPITCGDNPYSPYGADYFYAVHGLMLDRPYVGQRTFDVLRVIEWLASCGHEHVHLAARGWGALPAAFAALLDDRVAQVTLLNALTSYGEVAESSEYGWPLSTFLPGVLKGFDLPDCYRALEAKRLRLIEPWGASAGGPR